jgi:hypothetical protein
VWVKLLKRFRKWEHLKAKDFDWWWPDIFDMGFLVPSFGTVGNGLWDMDK